MTSYTLGMDDPECCVRHEYKGLVIEIELYRERDGGFHAMPYVVKSRRSGSSRRRFVLDVERFDTKETALQAAIVQGQKKIDEGFDPELE